MAGSQARFTQEFLLQFRAIANLPLERANVLLRATAARVGEAVCVGNQYGPGTPVDTGNARGHWYATKGSEAPPRDPNAEVKGATQVQSLMQMATVVATLKVGEVINYVNDVPYIEALNNGHSGQAPAGMTDAVIASFDQIVLAEAARLGLVAS